MYIHIYMYIYVGIRYSYMQIYIAYCLASGLSNAYRLSLLRARLHGQRPASARLRASASRHNSVVPLREDNRE